MTMSADQRPSRTTKALHGKKILITRPREQPADLPPCCARMAPSLSRSRRFRSFPPLLGAARSRTDGHSLLPVAGLHQCHRRAGFFRALRCPAPAARGFGGLSICAIGPATADELRGRGVRVDVMPSEYRAEAVVKVYRRFPYRTHAC